MAPNCSRWLAALACATAIAPAFAGMMDGFRDPVDGRFDASQWLLDRKGFLPVPIVVTEPAVGYGAGIAALFFHRNEATGASDRLTPPDITAVAAFGTENGTKGGALGHLGFTADRRWRYVAAAGYTSLNLTWYGGAGGDGLPFNLDGSFAIGDVRRRFGDSDWWAGMRYVGLKMKTRLGAGDSGDIPSRDMDAVTSGAGLVVEYDGRDNIFTASRGTRVLLQALRYSEALGSDSEYDQVRASLLSFWPIGKDVVIGLRADVQGVNGDVPFYARPFLELRGIPLMRYQGDRTALVEVEGRWNLDGRWSAVAFAGAGRAAAGGDDLGSAPTRTTYGLGGRYLLARALGMHVGLDVARGPEKTAVYLIMGSAWR